MKSESSIIMETITENTGINDHIDFIDHLINNHEWSDEQKKELRNQLEVVIKKQNDKNLYLAVVGEFNSGKSSFINALLRDELLKTDIIQGTTSAITELHYGDSISVNIKHIDSQTVRFLSERNLFKRLWRKLIRPKPDQAKADIYKYIKEITSDEDYASKIEKVTITHNSDTLADGLVIIDTPGTNVENQRHEEVTTNAIRNLSDAAIIVLSSDKQLPTSLKAFINNNLNDMVSKCIFIVNKMDLIQEKEHKRVLDYVESRLKIDFSMNKVNVFPYTPLAVLKSVNENIEFNCENEITERLYIQSGQTENKIIDILKQQRTVIQLQRLVLLINCLFRDLENGLNIMSNSYSNRHDALQKNCIHDLKSFVLKQKKKHIDSIKNESHTVRADIDNLICDSKNNLVGNFRSSIYGATSHSQLNSFIKNEKKVRELIQSEQTTLQSNLNIMMNDLHKILEIEKGIFEKDFNRLYNKLATLGGNLHIDSNSLSLGMTNVLGEHISGNISEYKHITKFENKKFSDASITGAVACGVIGTIIFPGVGTLIGAAIGSLIGFFNRTSLEDLKDNYFSKIESSLENSFDEAADSIEKHSDLIIDQMNAEICKLIDYYFEKYNVLVAEMIRRDELEKKDLQEKTTLIKKSIAELKNRQEVVENLKSRIEAL